MNKSEILIDIHLKEANCTMICPGYIYKKDENDIPRWENEIERNPDNLKKLENIISTTMIKRHQQELIETLEKKIPNLYIDCSKKGDDDIMFFIFKEYIAQSQAQNKTAILAETIGDHSIVHKSKDSRNEYINTNTPTVEEILDYYTQSLKQLLEENSDPEYTKSLLNFEIDITTNGLSSLMKNEGQKYLYLYLDNIQNLSIDEQQRINTLLYKRGGIENDRWIRVKINNGQGFWKTRNSSIGHRTESKHDYSEINIRESELE